MSGTVALEREVACMILVDKTNKTVVAEVHIHLVDKQLGGILAAFA